MRKLLAALGLALVAAGALTFPPAATPASAQAAVSISLFYRDLAPHGRWFQHPRWGWAWFPTSIDADWRPYSRGRWVWTEENGWYWDSDEPFGWAVYHYGRWAYDEEYGWIWIPGSTWGPAWVAFRDSDEYVGWAPLPPETLDASHDWAPSYTELDASYYQPRWVFIPRRHFLSRRVYTYAAPVQRNVVIIRATRNVTHYERGRRGVFNRSLEPRRLEAALGRRITPVRIHVVDNPRRVGPDRRGAQVNVYRPSVHLSREAAPPAEARARAQDRPRVRIRRDAVAPSERRERAAPPTAAPGARPPAEPPRTATPDRLDRGDRRGPDIRRGERDDRGRGARPGREDRRVTTPMQPPAAQPPGANPPAARMPERAAPRPGTPSLTMPPTPRSAQPDPRRGRDRDDRARDERGRLERRAAPPQGLGPSAGPRAAPAPRSVTRPDVARPPAALPQRPPAAAAPPRSAPPSAARPTPRAAPSAPPAMRAQPAPPPRAQPPAMRAQPAPPRAQPPAPRPQPPAARPAAPPSKSSPPPKQEEKKGRGR
jgi:hypothetical protein